MYKKSTSARCAWYLILYRRLDSAHFEASAGKPTYPNTNLVAQRATGVLDNRNASVIGRLAA